MVNDTTSYYDKSLEEANGGNVWPILMRVFIQ